MNATGLRSCISYCRSVPNEMRSCGGTHVILPNSSSNSTIFCFWGKYRFTTIPVCFLCTIFPNVTFIHYSFLVVYPDVLKKYTRLRLSGPFLLRCFCNAVGSAGQGPTKL